MSPRYNPRSATSGTKPRPCQNCGRRGHEHKRKRTTDDDGRLRFELHCPEDLEWRSINEAQTAGESP